MSLELEGIHFMMPTPFDDDGKVDEASIGPLVEMAARAGCRGVVCLGVMGEAPRLSDVERNLMVERVVEAAKGHLTVTVGTTATGTEVAVQRSVEAQQMGADTVMVAPPPIGKQNLDALFEYYQAVTSGLEIPVVVQDYPQQSGVFMPPSFIARLHQELPGAQYLKLEDPPTPPKVTAVRKAAGDTLGVFGGLGGIFLLEELSRGACGTMTGFAYPDVLVKVYRHMAEGDDEKARAVFYRYLPMIRYESQEGISLSLRKEVLKRRGVLASAKVRHPGPEIDELTRQELYRTLEAMELD